MEMSFPKGTRLQYLLKPPEGPSRNYYYYILLMADRITIFEQVLDFYMCDMQWLCNFRESKNKSNSSMGVYCIAVKECERAERLLPP